ncbi:MAG: hypothetical protein ACOYYU_20500 [Chloroflexota bacterium]
MEGITALINQTLFALCLLVLIPSLAAGLSISTSSMQRLRRAQPGKAALWGGLLALSALLFLAAAWALVTLPRFDFVDRCRPAGTGACLDGRSFSAVQWEIFCEQLLVVFTWLVLPMALGTGGLLFLIQKRPGGPSK